MNISMNEEQMTALVSKAIFDSLTTEAKDEMLQKALRHLMTKPEDRNGYYGDKRTPLEVAFQSAAREVTERVARQKLQDDPAFAANLESLFADLGKRIFEGPLREKLINTMANSVLRNFGVDP